MSKFIVEIQNALTSADCREIIRRFDQEDRIQPGETALGLHHDRKLSSDFDLSKYPDWQDIDQRLRRSLQNGLQAYANRHESFGAIARYGCAGFRVHKYPPDGFFDWHIDSYNKDVSSRILSCIWYLNTVEHGGQTEFKYQNISVRPEEGKLMMFPAGFEYLHRGAPPVGQDKYIVVAFVEHL